MNAVYQIKMLWHLHGTKVIGFGAAVVGTLEVIDQATVQLIQSFFGPHWGPYVGKAILIFSGLMAARRGYRNSNPPQPPVQPK